MKQNSINRFSVENFKAIGKRSGIDIAPITILTGCNSSGKSSFVKAMMLLSDCMNNICSGIERYGDININNIRLNFSNNRSRLMGSFDKIKNNSASQDDAVVIEYRLHSNLLASDATMELSFVDDKNDLMNNGWLSQIKIKNAKGEVFVSATVNRGQGKIEFVNVKCIEQNMLNWVNAAKKSDIQSYVSILDQLSSRSVDEAMQNIQSWANTVKKSGVLCYVPILDQLSSLSVDEAITYMMNINAEYTLDESIVCNIETIAKELKWQNYSSFGEYYSAKEVATLSNIKLIEEGYDRNFLGSIEECVVNSVDPRHLSKNQISPNESIEFKRVFSTLCSLHQVQNPDTIFDSGKTARVLKGYICDVVKELFDCKCIRNAQYISSNRLKVERLYTLSDLNSDFEQSILKHIKQNRSRVSLPLEAYDPLAHIPMSFVNQWIKRIGIGESVEISAAAEGLGAVIYVNKGDGSKVLLADEGYGISQLVSVLLQIDTAMSEAIPDCEPLGMRNHDFLPSIIAIEEPEIHLHPKYQSMLAEIFLDACKRRNIHFIIETHSEYLIRKYQTLVAIDEIKRENVALHYVENGIEKSNSPKVRRIEICEDGRLGSKLGDGFFDEADNLAMSLLDIKIRRAQYVK